MANSIVQSKFSFDPNTIHTDGLVNITALAKSYTEGWHPETVGMKPTESLTRDWLATQDAQASIAYLASTVGIPLTDLVKVKRGGNASGTWVHPDLAEIFAQWISVEYRFAVVQLIRTAKERKTSFESIANEKDWGKLRTDGKQYRRTYTDRIKEAGGKNIDYAKATNEIYIGATGLDAKQIKQQRGIVKSKPARDALNVGELQIVAMTEWHLSEALPNGSNLRQINHASRSQAERLKSALMVF